MVLRHPAINGMPLIFSIKKLTPNITKDKKMRRQLGGIIILKSGHIERFNL